MDFSKITYEQVLSMSSQLSSSASKMNDILNQVKAQFDKIGNDGTWSGTAASTNKEEFDRLSAQFPTFYEAIQDCSKYLNSMVENYKSVDQAVTGGR